MDGGLLEYFDVFLLVFARMGGMVFINPVFSRKGVPFMVRTGPVSYTHLDVYKRQDIQGSHH